MLTAAVVILSLLCLILGIASVVVSSANSDLKHSNAAIRSDYSHDQRHWKSDVDNARTDAAKVALACERLMKERDFWKQQAASLGYPVSTPVEEKD